MTSMVEQLGRQVSISEVKEPLANAFEHVFATELETTSDEKLTDLARSAASLRT
jgi:hypothetical protein